MPEIFKAGRGGTKKPVVLEPQGGAEPFSGSLDPRAPAKANGQGAGHYFAEGGPEREHLVRVLLGQIHVLEQGHFPDSGETEPGCGEEKTEGREQDGKPRAPADPEHHRFERPQPFQGQRHQESGPSPQRQGYHHNVAGVREHAEPTGAGRDETPQGHRQRWLRFRVNHE